MKIIWDEMGTTVLATGLALAVLMCGNLRLMAEEAKSQKIPDKAPSGSPDFRPSPERPVGWRGDGTGRYPGATPPLHWGRVAMSVKNLRSQATKPKEGETGNAIADGMIREWLILGPVPVPDELKKLDKDVLPEEAKMDPNEGEKIGDLAWKKVSMDNQTIVFRELFGIERQTQVVAYACAYVHSEKAQKLAMNVMWSGGRLWVNGAPVAPYLCKAEIGLQQGWNRFLFRVHCVKPSEYGAGPEPIWYLRSMFYGVEGSESESENIAWSTRLPGGAAISTPIIVGDKLFVTTAAKSLCCLDKNDGRLLWIRTITLFDVATEEEKKANPAVFQEIAPLASKLSAIDRSLKPGAALTSDLIAPGMWVPSTKVSLEGAIWKLMQKVDPQKYKAYPSGECGDAAATPTSDGRNVYATFHPYLNACFDLDGNMQWVAMHAWDPPYKGTESHGLYASSVLLDGNLFVTSDRTFALDAKTGKPVWQNVAADGSACGSLVALTLGKEPILATPVTLYRARDGKPLFSDKKPYYYGCFATPVVADGKIFRLFGRGGTPGTTVTDRIRLPGSSTEPFNPELMKGMAIDTTRFPRWCDWYMASSLYHEGLLYCLNVDGVLSVVDTEKQEVIYQKLLDLDLSMDHVGNASRGGACSSPTLAGKHIYFFGHRGTCVVIEPGRSFRSVARNRIDGGAGDTDIIASCPVFEKNRLYYRGTSNLYCIEERK